MTMQARKKLKAGQDGTKSLLEEDGSRLICARDRDDEERPVGSKGLLTADLPGDQGGSLWL